MESTSFTVQEAARITGANERNIRFWCSPAELIIPEIANPQVQRSPKLFSLRNLFQLAVVDLLSRRGIGLDVLREMLRAKRAGDWWLPALDETEIIILRGGKKWTFEMVPVAPMNRVLPKGLAEALQQALAEYQDIVAVNLSDIKQKILKAK